MSLLAVACALGVVLPGCVQAPGDLFDDVALQPESEPTAPEVSTTPEVDAVEEPQAPVAPVAPQATPGEASAAAGAALDPGSAAPEEDDGASPVEPEAPAPAPEPPVTDTVDPPLASGPRVCPPPAESVLLDFEGTGNELGQALFGDFDGQQLSGGTYVYPTAEGAVPGPFGLSSRVAAGGWEIAGNVAEQAGFGLFFDCQLLDASAFAGIAFRIQGDIERAGQVTLLVGTASNEVSSNWLLANGQAEPGPSFGRCQPDAGEFDGSCDAARMNVPVSAAAREVFVPFAALNGGSPAARVDPSEITSIAWALPAPAQVGGGSVPFAVDVRIDDIRFVTAPPAAVPPAAVPPAAVPPAPPGPGGPAAP